jgi:ferrous iron transport protein B
MDIPGTYSLISNSPEEEISRNYICFGGADATIVVIDGTCIERNLNLVYQILEITKNVIVCVNLLDEASKKNISINLGELSSILGVPVVGAVAKKKKTLKLLMDKVHDVCLGRINCIPKLVKYANSIEKSILLLAPIIEKNFYKNKYLHRWIALKLIDDNKDIIHSIEEHLHIDLTNNEEIIFALNNIQSLLLETGITKTNLKDRIISSIVYRAEDVCNDILLHEQDDYNRRDRKIDKVLTSKTFGFPIMIFFLSVIFWITIVFANYPTELLFSLFNFLESQLLIFFEFIYVPPFLSSIIILGVFRTLTWVIAVMLPPMAIFFPLFTLLEDLGYLPRIAFNLDKLFKKACTSGKQSLTMCMGNL